ncbi:MAG: histidine--tRNA ligase [Bacteroidales bacterium]|nr:histidine--tRNA ligase [Bacteroidales bacterium]MCF6342017.1 histidine--tRNA ligase [Bacteroidales bacterium]
MAQKPSIPKGTRDFSPTEMSRRNYIFDTIKSVFQNFGYLPIETPAMENLSTLMGKYGEEGDRLLFKILNSGDYLKNVTLGEDAAQGLNKITRSIAEKGLRYDLTVPFARYVAQHRNEITFPFKRYQVQPVWRADRPQKGRYREFFQCDVDVIGSNSLLNEVELIRMIDDIFCELKMGVVIKINNRKILSGIAEVIAVPEKLTDITTAIDKIDKIGLDKVYEELRSKGLTDETIQMLEPIINLGGDNQKKLNCLREFIGTTADGSQGITELQTVIDLLNGLDIRSEVEIDQSLARGLNYYTGAIIEVKAKKVGIGSVCGGGRYDNLTGVFGLPDVSGVGVSFGADRIYDVLNELDLFPEQVHKCTKVMLVNFGGKEAAFSLNILQQLQRSGIPAELYPDTVKMKKQMKYADQKAIRFVLLIGDEEMKTGVLTLKDMESGEQHKLEMEQLTGLLK